MFYYLHYLSHVYSVCNIFRYITFRTIASLLTAFFVSLLFGRPLIRWLKRKQKNGQPIRKDGPEKHLVTKQGIPTMGGVIIIISLLVSIILWSDYSNPFLWIAIVVTLGFGILGGYDDFLKLKKLSHKGLKARYKLIVQIVLSLGAVYIVTVFTPVNMRYVITVPFFKDVALDISFLYYAWAVLVVVGSSNAVNLTDGLDGLAIVPAMIVAACFCIISYVVGHTAFSNYLYMNYIPSAGELSVLLGALIGGGLGFLWFNAPPAKIFMGDTGSLAIGGLLGITAVIVKHEIILAITGGLFVIETLSVMIQVIYFKFTKKRIFLMAPIHHHFEKKGWEESVVVIRFWIIASLLALIGLLTLKVR
ncbi:MAG: phospho-N-acetylmuramoyl-pentapeptide-transferase [Alphaproteobacteria bacterium]